MSAQKVTTVSKLLTHIHITKLYKCKKKCVKEIIEVYITLRQSKKYPEFITSNFMMSDPCNS